MAYSRLTKRSSGRVRIKCQAHTAACAPLSSTVRRQAVAEQRHFIAELFKRQPLGVFLVVVGALSFIFTTIAFEAKLDVGPMLGGSVVITFLAWVVGFPLVHRAAWRLQ